MAGAYCKFCGHRCFVDRVIPDGPMKGWSGHLATCQGGMAHDLEVTGHTHETALNPVTQAIAVEALAARLCDHCGQQVQTGMPDGREFEWVHADGGTRRCADGSGNQAAFQGTTGQRYA
jgi:hypothetical protein